MKILMLNPFSKFAAVRQYNLATQLANKHEVTLCLPKFDKYSGYKKITAEAKNGLNIVHPLQLPFKNIELSMMPYVPSAHIKLMKGDYDIVHAFRPLPFSALIGYQIAKAKKIPFVLEMGDIESETMNKLDCHPGYRKKLVSRMEANLIKKADMITCMNKQVKKFIMEKYNIPKSRIQIISNGVDTELFSPAYAKILNLLEARDSEFKTLGCKHLTKLMYVGKLDNIEHIRKFVSQFKKLGKKYVLFIIGDGDKRDELESIATGDVRFLGRMTQDKLPVYMNEADILIAPFSQTEGVEHASNLKIFEYMSMAKPVVVTDIGDKAEVLNGYGYTYEADNMQDLKNVLKNIDTNIGKNAREYVKKKYDWSVLAKQLTKTYTQALNTNKREDKIKMKQKLTDIYRTQLKEYYETDTEYFDILDDNFYKNMDEYTQLLQPEYFKNKKVLDAGCGSGAFTHWLAENYKSKVTGVDLSPYAIKEAKKKYKGKFIVGDIADLPFRSKQFDTILLYDVLEHVIYPENVFKELGRVLKKGGHIIIVSPNMLFNKNVPKMTKLKEMFETVTLPFKSNFSMSYIEPDVSQCACGDKEATLITNPFKISKMLKEHGFEIEKNIFGRCIFIAKKIK